MLGGLSDKDVRLINEVFAKYQFVKMVKLFGSRAKGNFKRGSDIDLVLFTDNSLPAFELNSDKSGQKLALLSDELEEQLSLPYFFDLVVNSSGPVNKIV